MTLHHRYPVDADRVYQTICMQFEHHHRQTNNIQKLIRTGNFTITQLRSCKKKLNTCFSLDMSSMSVGALPGPLACIGDLNPAPAVEDTAATCPLLSDPISIPDPSDSPFDSKLFALIFLRSFFLKSLLVGDVPFGKPLLFVLPMSYELSNTVVIGFWKLEW